MKWRRPELSQNYQYIRLRGHAEEEGRKVWHMNGKRVKVERGASLTEGGTYQEVIHSNIFTVKPIYCLFAHPLNLNSSPLSLYCHKSTKAVILITAGGRVMSAVAERPREETLDDSSRNSIRRSMYTSRLLRDYKLDPIEVPEQRQDRFDNNDFASRRANRACLLVKEKSSHVCFGLSTAAEVLCAQPHLKPRKR